MRNTIIFSAVLFVAVIVASVFYFRNLDKEQNHAARPLRHLPGNTMLIVSLRNNEVSDNIFKDFDVFEALLGREEVNLLAQFKNQILRHEEIGAFVQDAEIYISFHPAQKGTDMLLTIPTTTMIPENQLPNLLHKMDTRYKVSETDTLGHRIYALAYGSKDSVLHILYHQNIFFASHSIPLLSRIVDKVTRHLPDEQIDFFLKNSSRNTPLSIYFPHQQYDSIVHLYQRRDGGPFLDLFKNLQGQSAWNINFRQDALMLTGESELDQYSENYVSLFKNQQKKVQSLYGFFPANTALYMEYSISDRSKFQKDLKDLFKRRKESVAQEIDTTNLGERLEQVLGNEFACIETANQNYMAFVRLHDTTAWKEIQDLHFEKTTDSIFRFKTPNVLYRKFGDPFKLLARPYVTFVKDVLILANSSHTLRAYREDWRSRNLLTGTLGFKSFEKLQSYEANVTLFVHTGNARQKITNSLTQPFQDNFKDTENFGFQDFHAWSVQLSGNNGKISSQVYAVYQSKSALGVTPEWTYSFENSAITQPYVFEHSDTSKFILIQELDHTIHAIHPTGHKLWSTVFSGRVIGEIQQLEDRTVVLVTDKNRLYRFNTDGKVLPGFSVPLPEEPIAAPTIVTINNSKVMLITGQKTVYAYDLNGNNYTDWHDTELQGNVTGPIQRINDRFVLATDMGKVYFLDERGHLVQTYSSPEEVEIQNPLTVSGQLAWWTDNMGYLNKLALNGNAVRHRVDEGLPKHFSDFVNINATSIPELILVDKGHLRVYDIADSARLLFDYNFTKDIVNRPQYFESVSNRGQYLLGIASRPTNLLYLFEANGNVMEGFPVEGLPLFYYGRINYNSDTYLLTMRRDRRLYAFKHQK